VLHIIKQEAEKITNWVDLIEIAEFNSMAPLLAHALETSGATVPIEAKCTLHLLKKRHREKNKILLSELGDIAKLFDDNQIRFLVLKGAALSSTLYSSPDLRPMRDLDILVDPKQIYPARDVLIEKGGYSDPDKSNDHPDHHHLPPVRKLIGHTHVHVELHRGIFLYHSTDSTQVDFEGLYNRAINFSCNISVPFTARTLGAMDMLIHVFDHGLRAPLGSESYRLSNITDIMGFISKEHDHLDWQQLVSKRPDIYHTLPFLDLLSPWPDEVRSRLVFKYNRQINGVGEIFSGWPKDALGRFRREKTWEILHKTFFPPEWWMLTYYAPRNRAEALYHLLVKHPMNVFYWTLIKTRRIISQDHFNAFSRLSRMWSKLLGHIR